MTLVDGSLFEPAIARCHLRALLCKCLNDLSANSTGAYGHYDFGIFQVQIHSLSSLAEC